MSCTGRFRRSDRLLDSRDFRRVSRHGKRSASKYFVVLRAGSRRPGRRSARSGADGASPSGGRLGITVSRKVGNAVTRNYVKRSVREWFRGARLELPERDFVVIARRDASRLRGSELQSELDQLVARGEVASR